MYKTIQEVFVEKLDAFTHEVQDMIANEYDKRDEFNPTMFALSMTKKGMDTNIIVGLEQLYSNDNAKDAAASFLKDTAKKLKAVAIAYASEGWLDNEFSNVDLTINKNGSIEGFSTKRNSVNSQEVVVINFETFDKQCIRVIKIIRTGTGVKLNLENKFNWHIKTVGAPGRFMNLLMDNYSLTSTLLQEKLKNNLN